MASIPAIITSKYFHDGLALDVTNVPPGMPPRLKPENTLLTEIMKRKNYRTGVIASHEYWNDWGMDQGVDDYDNSIGHTPDPFRIAADKVTDSSLAWISREQGRKWFLWAHYIDPHGRYMAQRRLRLDRARTSTTRRSRTDQQIGRLLDELQRLPSTPNTINVITSDHGDSMGEHNKPGRHARHRAIPRNLQNVPMIFYIPDNAPHLIGGVTTNLDIVPTIAEPRWHRRPRSLVRGPQRGPGDLYGNEDHSRIVFAETNAPTRSGDLGGVQAGSTTSSRTSKFALRSQGRSVGAHQPRAEAPARVRSDEGRTRRVAWNASWPRDAAFNQSDERINDVLLGTTAPKPEVETTGQTLDGGKIQITGLGADGKVVAGGKVDLHVYFRVNERTSEAYRFLLAMWPVDPRPGSQLDAAPATMLRSQLRATADGFFTSERWREHEYVRERFPMTIPADYKGAIAGPGRGRRHRQEDSRRPAMPWLTTRNSSFSASCRSREAESPQDRRTAEVRSHREPDPPHLWLG